MKKVRIVVLCISIIIALVFITQRDRLFYRYNTLESNFGETLVRTNVITGKSQTLDQSSMKWQTEEDLKLIDLKNQLLLLEEEKKDIEYQIEVANSDNEYFTESLEKGNPVEPVHADYIILSRRNPDYDFYSATQNFIDSNKQKLVDLDEGLVLLDMNISDTKKQISELESDY